MRSISSRRSPTGTTASDRVSTAGSASRSAAPRFFPSQLSKLATAIGDVAREIKEKTERIELDAAERRCRALAGEITDWLHQEDSRAVYWVEVEEKSRQRVRLASAPLDVAPALRKLLFEEVPTCVLTSATLCIGSPPTSISCSPGWGSTEPKRWRWAARSITLAR